jgi:hypothetical protein
VPGEAVDAAATSSPPASLPAPTSIPAEVAASVPAEPPVAADVEMAKVPPPPAPSVLVVLDSPVFDYEEGAADVAEVDERSLVVLTEERPDASAVEGPNASVVGHADSWPVVGSSGLIPMQLNPNEWGGYRLCSGAATPQSLSLPLMMSWRRSCGVLSVSIARRR